MKKLILIISTIIFVCISGVFASDTPFFFESARTIGMGGAFTAIADDENAILYNPAGLSKIKTNIINMSSDVMYYEYNFAQRRYKYVNSNTAIRYVRNNIGIQAYFKYMDGGFFFHDYLGEGGYRGEFQLTVSIGGELSENLRTGLNFKVAPGGGLNSQSTRFMFDLGIQYDVSDSLTIGMLLHDLVDFGRETYYVRDNYGNYKSAVLIPRDLNIGISYRFSKNILLSFDIKNIYGDNKYKRVNIPAVYPYFYPVYKFQRSYHLGAEYLANKDLFFRVGVSEKLEPQDFFYYDLIFDPLGGVQAGSLETFYSYKYVWVTMLSLGTGFVIDGFKIDFSLTNDFREAGDIKAPFRLYLSTSYIF